jgi:uncharacterized phage infection (PIP) family protein YhgE
MRRWRLVVLTGCVVTACCSLQGSAFASDASVRTAIEVSRHQVKESGELQEALKELRENPKTLEKIHRGIAEFDSALRKVISKVSGQHASTTSGKRGESEYLGGLHKLVAGFGDLDKAITDLKDHNKTGAKAELKKAAALVKAGVEEAKKGRAALHVKS